MGRDTGTCSAGQDRRSRTAWVAHHAAEDLPPLRDVLQPDPRMFHHALDALRIPEPEWPRVAMVGNNLARDIRGANALGLISLHIVWNDRYPTAPADDEERPRHVVRSAAELDRLIQAYAEGAPSHA